MLLRGFVLWKLPLLCWLLLTSYISIYFNFDIDFCRDLLLKLTMKEETQMNLCFVKVSLEEEPLRG